MALYMKSIISTSNESTVFSFSSSSNNQCAQTQWELVGWLIVDLQRSFSVNQITIIYHEELHGKLRHVLFLVPRIFVTNTNATINNSKYANAKSVPRSRYDPKTIVPYYIQSLSETAGPCTLPR